MNSKQDVAGGSTLESDHEFPHLVSLQYARSSTSAPSHFCGGSIISKKYILTAAHCLSVQGMDTAKIKVVAGTSNRDCLSNGGSSSGSCIVRSITRAITHPNYNSQYIRNDIGLLELSEDLPLDTQPDSVKAIPIEGGQIPWETLVLLAGWGRTTDASQDIPTVAQKAYLPVRQASVCNAQNLGMQTPYQVCAGEGRGVNSCQGDSGGPLFWKKTTSSGTSYGLIGLVSYGPEGCGKSNSFGVYTNATYWINYIKNYASDVSVSNFGSSTGGGGSGGNTCTCPSN